MLLNGSTLYLGGTMSHQTDSLYFAAVDTGTGVFISGLPTFDGQVSAISLAGNTLYLGGAFRNAAGQTRDYLAAYDLGTATLTEWKPGANQPVNAIAASDSGVYAGGSFSCMNGVWRNNLAAINATTGTPLDWAPNPTSQGTNNGSDQLSDDGQQPIVLCAVFFPKSARKDAQI